MSYAIKHMHALGGVQIGCDVPPRIMGIINVSPESYYSKSISSDAATIRNMATQMEESGADFIDVGGMSTAPYRDIIVSEQAESDRVCMAISNISDVCDMPISVDTHRSGVAMAALDAGATILNDVTGLAGDSDIPHVISRYEPSLILCAHDTGLVSGDTYNTAEILRNTVKRAVSYGADPNHIAIDPAIGFFRDTVTSHTHTRISYHWARRDISILSDIKSVGDGMPILVSVSSKSFIGEILDRPNPEERMYGSLAAETAAVLNGADIVRTHHVYESRDAALVAAAIAGRIIS